MLDNAAAARTARIRLSSAVTVLSAAVVASWLMAHPAPTGGQPQ